MYKNQIVRLDNNGNQWERMTNIVCIVVVCIIENWLACVL